MATRVRQSVPPPSAATAAGNQTQAPPYERPLFTLNPNAQRDFAKLLRNQHLKQLEKRFVDAQQDLVSAAGEMNDRVTLRAEATRKRKLRDPDSTPDGLERPLEELRDKVERMTQRMDGSMRKLIDGQVGAQFMRDVLEHTATESKMLANTQASTLPPPTQTQRPARRGVNGDEADSDSDEEQGPRDFTPTDPGGGTQAVRPPIELFRSRLDDAKTRYLALSLTERYTGDSKYVEFRRTVHDAKFPNEEQPMPAQHGWFQDDAAAPAPGVTKRRPNDGGEEDSDEDLAIERSTISTKCPLTLRELTHPLSSKKCPHTFEASAIREFIGTRSAVQCPVGGCNESLSKRDLHTDPVLVRKIKRLQRAKELEAEEAEDEEGDQGDRSHAHVVGSGDGSPALTALSHDDDEMVKDELRQSTAFGVKARTERPPVGGAIVLMDDSSDEGYDVDDDEAEEAEGDENEEEEEEEEE